MYHMVQTAWVLADFRAEASSYHLSAGEQEKLPGLGRLPGYEVAAVASALFIFFFLLARNFIQLQEDALKLE